jgi:fructokinase
MNSTPYPVCYDVTALGELVIDLIPTSRNGDKPLLAAKPGGAPGNVAAGIARLGGRAAMLSKIGPGYFGDLLSRTLKDAGVDTQWIIRSTQELTSLAIVTVGATGERDFALYREGCADATLSPREIPLDVVRKSRILHVGSLSLATPMSREAQRLAVATSVEMGRLVSVDVNLRPALWRDKEAMIATGREAVLSGNIVKVNEEELRLLAGNAGIDEAVQTLWHSRLKVLAVTKGANGAHLFTDTHRVDILGLRANVVDTVGCGDAFMASMLSGLFGCDIDALREEDMQRVGRSACAAGAAMAEVAGAMERMPRLEDINRMLALA